MASTREFILTPQGVMVKIVSPAPSEGLEEQLSWEGPISLTKVNETLTRIKNDIDQHTARLADMRVEYVKLMALRNEVESLEFPPES